MPSNLKAQEITRHQSLGEAQTEIPPPNVPEGETKDIVGKEEKVVRAKGRPRKTPGAQRRELPLVHNMAEPIATRTRNKAKAYEASICQIFSRGGW